MIVLVECLEEAFVEFTLEILIRLYRFLKSTIKTGFPRRELHEYFQMISKIPT